MGTERVVVSGREKTAFIKHAYIYIYIFTFVGKAVRAAIDGYLSFVVSPSLFSSFPPSRGPLLLMVLFGVFFSFLPFHSTCSVGI